MRAASSPDLDAIRRAYEAGEALDRIARAHGMGRRRVRQLGADHGWVRPARSVLSHAEMRHDYEHGGFCKQRLAQKYRVKITTITALIASQGWRHGGDDAGNQDPPPHDALGERLEALGYARRVAPPAKHFTTKGPWAIR